MTEREHDGSDQSTSAQGAVVTTGTVPADGETTAPADLPDAAALNAAPESGPMPPVPPAPVPSPPMPVPPADVDRPAREWARPPSAPAPGDDPRREAEPRPAPPTDAPPAAESAPVGRSAVTGDDPDATAALPVPADRPASGTDEQPSTGAPPFTGPAGGSAAPPAPPPPLHLPAPAGVPPRSQPLPAPRQLAGIPPRPPGSPVGRPAPTGPSRPAGQPAPARGRRARLNLRRIDPWSVFLYSVVASIFLGVALVVAAVVLFAVLSSLGVIDSVNTLIGDVTADPGGAATPSGAFSAGSVIGVTSVLAAINVILLTALATLGAFLYNLVAQLTGGIEVTLGDRD